MIDRMKVNTYLQTLDRCCNLYREFQSLFHSSMEIYFHHLKCLFFGFSFTFLVCEICLFEVAYLCTQSTSHTTTLNNHYEIHKTYHRIYNNSLEIYFRHLKWVFFYFSFTFLVWRYVCLKQPMSVHSATSHTTTSNEYHGIYRTYQRLYHISWKRYFC